MELALENPEVLSLAAGFTDNRTLPVDAVEGAATALAQREGEPDYLQYGTNRGRPGLRRLLAARLRAAEPGLPEEGAADRMMVTNGSQQMLYLAIQVLCEEGDVVLVDRPSYFVFLEMLAGLGVQALSLPVDQHGRLDFAALEAMIDRLRRSGQADRIKAVYLVSYFSNPSGRSLGADEKAGLARVLTGSGLIVPVIEDAAYRDLFFRTPASARAMIGMEEWRPFPLLYAATLTKPFATGMKIGYGYCTHDEWLARMLHVKGHHDFGTANFTQAILELAIQRGDFDRHLAAIRPVYEGKMHALHETLVAEGLSECGWAWQPPQGGLYLWLEAPVDLDTGQDSAFCRACVEEGVLYVPGELCFADSAPRRCVRLSFGVLEPSALREAGKRFCRVARKFAPAFNPAPDRAG